MVDELLEKALREQMCKDVDGATYYTLKHRNRQELANLEKEVKGLIAKHDLSASEARGFLEYMKFIVDVNSYLPKTK